ncbi:protein FAM83E-like [Hypanus sabinus]|uniref:protein FAM83E-like n=1 Tax=Hypanus sabinus TaxID=79690 RepID=UPI0028C3D86E|nr:protein FAM83E-like [Hypanus sabinus]
MASSQLQCLDEQHVNPCLTESLPQFVYSEGQRRALEALLSDGPSAYAHCLEEEGLRPFLSAAEAHSLLAGARPFRPSDTPGQQEDEELLEGPNGRELTRLSTANWSLTYWPTQSDAPPPFLALGWPEEGMWKGITRAAVYTNPPAEGAPTIKELVRRLLQNAQQVIAIVMDQFTDVDIFIDLVDTSRLRKIPVYVLLDQLNLPLFMAMARATNTNLWLLEHMRVRVLAGCSFCSRNGLTVDGSVKERFLLVDAEKVVTGSYSFTWTDARLHRHLATLLTGQVVDAFDREFRTLYASSRPLPQEALLNGTLMNPPSLLAGALGSSGAVQIPTSLGNPPPFFPAALVKTGTTVTQFHHLPGTPGNPGHSPTQPLRNPGDPGNLSPFAHRVASRRIVHPEPLPPSWAPLAGHRMPLGRPGVSPALSDILRNLRRARTTMENGPKGSRSLWNLSALSQLAGAPSLGKGSSVDPLELGEDAKTRLTKTLPTPAATLMRHRRVQKEEEEEGGKGTQPPAGAGAEGILP